MTKREMTIEEALELFKEVREDLIARETELSKQVFENLGLKAVDLAIKVLEQKLCEDCISREEAIRIAEQGQIQGYEWQFKKLCDLSSVTPQQNTGHWFIDERPESDRELVCSNCDQPIFKYHKLEFDYRPKYCPNCGANMKSEDKNE